MPMAAVTIGIDLLTVLWVVGRVWLIRESDPIWFQIICQNDGIGEISSTIAIILTFLILKPIDLILDKIWASPGRNGVAGSWTDGKWRDGEADI